MTIAIVILNWNTREILEEFLPLVISNSQTPGVEIIVADNGSTDGSVQWLRECYPGVRVLEFKENLGFAGGYNRALLMIDATISILLNSDVAPAPGWLPPLIETMRSNPGVVACVPKIKDYKRPGFFEYAGAAGGFIDRLGYPFCRGRIFNHIEEDNSQYDKAGTVFWGSGAALVVYTAKFNSSGGFDPDFFAHMEEIDWCWRMRNIGYIVMYNPGSQVFHLGGGTLGYQSERKTFLNFRNNLFMILKNYPGNGVYPLLVTRFLMDLLAMANFLKNGRWRHALAVTRAQWAFITRFPHFLKKRKELMAQVKVKKHREVYQGSIVYDYFIKQRHYFSQIHYNSQL